MKSFDVNVSAQDRGFGAQASGFFGTVEPIVLARGVLPARHLAADDGFDLAFAEFAARHFAGAEAGEGAGDRSRCRSWRVRRVAANESVQSLAGTYKATP